MPATRLRMTFVEVLVVTTIIGVLIALLLPALEVARESSRRIQCAGRLMNLAIGMHHYHAAHATLPAGAYGSSWGTWQVAVLPHIEQQALFDRYHHQGKFDPSNVAGRYDSVLNRQVTTQQLPAFTCPSDTPSSHWQISAHNYVANFGNLGLVQDERSTTFTAAPDLTYASDEGAPFTLSGSAISPVEYFTFKSIRDGVSNTLMFSEVITGKGPATDLRGFGWWGPAAGFTTYLPPNTQQPDVLPSSQYCDSSVNPPCIGAHSVILPSMQAARSHHAGGVLAARCDGSVLFMSNEVSITVWRAIGTTQGNEMISDF